MIIVLCIKENCVLKAFSIIGFYFVKKDCFCEIISQHLRIKHDNH